MNRQEAMWQNAFLNTVLTPITIILISFTLILSFPDIKLWNALL